MTQILYNMGDPLAITKTPRELRIMAFDDSFRRIEQIQSRGESFAKEFRDQLINGDQMAIDSFNMMTDDLGPYSGLVICKHMLKLLHTKKQSSGKHLKKCLLRRGKLRFFVLKQLKRSEKPMSMVDLMVALGSERCKKSISNAIHWLMHYNYVNRHDDGCGMITWSYRNTAEQVFSDWEEYFTGVTK